MAVGSGRVDSPQSVLVGCQIDIVEFVVIQVVVALILDVRKDDASGDGFLGQVVAYDLARPVAMVVESSGVDSVPRTGVCVIQVVYNARIVVPVNISTHVSPDPAPLIHTRMVMELYKCFTQLLTYLLRSGCTKLS